MDKNSEFAELGGICWHIPENMTEVYLPASRRGSWICAKCNKRFTEDDLPDYAADTRLVLKEMAKRPDWDDFQKQVIDPFAYILDTTGLLLNKAIEFMRRRKP